MLNILKKNIQIKGTINEFREKTSFPSEVTIPTTFSPCEISFTKFPPLPVLY